MLEQLLQQREERLLRPMKVLEHDRPGCRTETRREISRHAERELAAPLVRRELARQSAFVGQRERRQLPRDRPSLLLVEPRHPGNPRLDLRSRCVARIRRGDRRLAADELLERSVGDRVAVGKTCRARHRLVRIEAAQELHRDSGLSDPGLAIDGDKVRPSGGGDTRVDLAQETQLGVAADEWTEVWQRTGKHRAQDLESGRRLDLSHALRLDQPWRVVLNAVARDLAGHRSDEDLAGLRVLLETRGDDDGAAGHEELRPFHIAGHDLAGVDPDAKGEPRAPLAARGHLRAQGDRRAHGAFGVILVRDRHPKHRHHGIADEFLDRRTVGDEDLARPGKRAREGRAEHLGVIRASRAARIDDVRKQDGYDLPFLRHGPSLEARG